MGKVVSISFAGKRPCKDCGSTTSQRGWISRADEIVCMSKKACADRQKYSDYVAAKMAGELD